MNEINKLELIFQELGEHWGFENFRYNNEQPNILIFNEILTVHLKQSENQKNLVIFVNLGPAYTDNATSEQKLQRLHKILEANLLWKDTSNGTLSLKSSGEVIYCYQTPINSLTSGGLEAFLDAFVNQATQLQQDLLTAPLCNDDSNLFNNDASMLRI
ncbi:type III secretion system chaperone [Pleionea sediminis]|uniref:type III secretion system chaperone n=1 Tax=Pleionea sediminis TaxID=2569479 RepID=UPI0011871834|nr:type III secretion system chaperone [Pleionea sediminis]